MMQFKALSILAVVMSASHVAANILPEDIINTIGKVTDLSSSTADAAKDIEGGNVLAAAPKLVTGFKDIVSTVTGAIPMLENEKPDEAFSEGDQTNICDAFTTFVEVHQDLLNVVIGKNSLLSSTPFTAPVAAVLRTLEGGVDTLAYSIIGLVPTCADKAQMDLENLDNTIGDAIDIYSS
ncbi:unnamed protein product [Clonostachys rosea]|uniref:Cell wall galactomannoprotein n=1 Tax=Bionectria ochroleuca TaxID=29856 RepID=A0ABY6UEA6_BIOOC|nr:unnamed protein product [Clonostachys rosea]